jgi:RNA polymerase sigma-70 factor (ECF subfamily)
MKVDENNFIRIYDKYIDEVYGFLFTRTGMNSKVAEELTQDTFTAVYISLSKFRGVCSERTWVYKIAQNRLMDYYRKMYRENSFVLVDDTEAADIDDPKQNVQDYIEKQYDSAQVTECLRRIPDHYRVLLIMKYIEDKRVKEIAEITGKTPKAVESMMTRAKEAFQKEYIKMNPEV